MAQTVLPLWLQTLSAVWVVLEPVLAPRAELARVGELVAISENLSHRHRLLIRMQSELQGPLEQQVPAQIQPRGEQARRG